MSRQSLIIVTVTLIILNGVLLMGYLHQKRRIANLNEQLIHLAPSSGVQNPSLTITLPTRTEQSDQKTINIKSEQPIGTPLLSPTANIVNTIPHKELIQEPNTGIQYWLPLNWDAEYMGSSFLITANEGGFFDIKWYEYDGKKGRREYYCELQGVCWEASYFTPMKIGNVDGYVAQGIDNSGGGPDYFFAKGSKFYIISSSSPSSSTPNEFDKYRNEVLNSLVF